MSSSLTAIVKAILNGERIDDERDLNRYLFLLVICLVVFPLVFIF
jgi:hypothetical protein